MQSRISPSFPSTPDPMRARMFQRIHKSAPGATLLPKEEACTVGGGFKQTYRLADDPIAKS